jgi:D-amino peptidase
MRKFFISADIEGCAAVTSRNALLPERWHWEWTAARRWMTQEVVVVAEAALANGYDEVIVCDSHGNAHNIEPDLLPDDVWLVRGWPRPLLHMQGVEDPAVEACAFIGYHASTTTPDSILAHTFSGAAFREVRLNGEICSEGYLNAALAGEFGCPVVLVTGDRQTVDDAKRYAPHAAGYVAKHAIGERCQMSLPPAQVQKELKACALDAVAKAPAAPFILQPPFELHLEMTTQSAAEMLSYLPHVARIGARGVAAHFPALAAAVRFVAFSMLYTPAGDTAL